MTLFLESRLDLRFTLAKKKGGRSDGVTFPRLDCEEVVVHVSTFSFRNSDTAQEQVWEEAQASLLRMRDHGGQSWMFPIHTILVHPVPVYLQTDG